MKPKETRSTGNIFRDVGFPRLEAEHLRIRSDLLVGLQEAVKARGLTQAAAAALLGVHQPRVSDLMRGRVDLFSMDTLVDMLARLGVRVRLILPRPRKRAGAA